MLETVEKCWKMIRNGKMVKMVKNVKKYSKMLKNVKEYLKMLRNVRICWKM